MARPNQTLLFLSPHELVRADFVSPHRLVSLHRATTEDASLPLTAPGATVWVLDSACSILASGPSWAIETSPSRTELYRQRIEQSGATFGGLLHPAGLPRPLLSPTTGPWRRIEEWPGFHIAIEGGTAAPRWWISSASCWRTDLAVWEAAGPRAVWREVLTATRSDTLGSEASARCLEDEESLALWLTAWAAQLATDSSVVPILKPTHEGIGWQHWLLALGVTSLLSAVFWSRPQPVEAKTGKFPRLLRAIADHRPDNLILRRIDGPPDQPMLQGLCLSADEAEGFCQDLAQQLQGEWAIDSLELEPRGPTHSSFRLSLRSTGGTGP